MGGSMREGRKKRHGSVAVALRMCTAGLVTPPKETNTWGWSEALSASPTVKKHHVTEALVILNERLATMKVLAH